MGASLRSFVLLLTLFSSSLGKPVAHPKRVVIFDTGNSTAVGPSGSSVGWPQGTQPPTFQNSTANGTALQDAASTTLSFGSISTSTPGNATSISNTSAPIFHNTTANRTAHPHAASTSRASASSSASTSAKPSENATSISNSSIPNFGGGGNFGSQDKGLALVNPNNFNCSSIPSFSGTSLWNKINGNSVLKTFDQMFQADALNCVECFGQTKDQCKSNSPDCASGIRTLASPNGNPNDSRWDTAVGRFSRVTGQFSINCEIGSSQCDIAPDCTLTDGPGAWAIWEQMVNLHDTLDNIYQAIGNARDQADTQMTTFSAKFAPLPSMEGQAITDTILGGVFCGLLGAIPGLGGIVAGTAAGVIDGVVMTNYFMSQPGPADTASILGFFANTTLSYYNTLATGLFQTGQHIWSSQDNSQTAVQSMEEVFQTGYYMEEAEDNSTFLAQMVPKYETILLQSTILYTWTNLQSDGVGHHPFIAFDPKPCDQVDPNDSKGLEQYSLGMDLQPFSGLSKLDVNVTLNGSCYYLLDAKPVSNPQTSFRGGATSTQSCHGNNALPAGTNADMNKNGQYFTGISLNDFIVPAVLGWQQNSKSNDYPTASANNQVVSDPQTPGAVNIPVCDFLGNSAYPGGNCPQLYNLTTGSPPTCPLTDYSGGTDAPGTYKPGWCRLHFVQYQKSDGDTNLLPEYQLEVDIYDNESRLIGQAPKQASGQPIEIYESTLPFHLIVATGKVDNDPVSFWYADQFWNSSSSSNQCSTGGYQGGSRNGDCGFQCPSYDNNPSLPVSATGAHPLPTAATLAQGNPTQFLNTWAEASTFAAPTPTPSKAGSAPPKPTYATGWCTFHLRQWQKNEGSSNPTENYEVEVTLYDASKPPKVVGTSGKVPAPKGQPVTVQGYNQPFNVTAMSVDTDPMQISFGNTKFNTSSTANQCATGSKADGYDSGHRDFDCGFTC